MVDDAAQAFGVWTEGKALGTLGDVGFYSFGRGKTVTSVRGGAIVTGSPGIARELDQQYQALPPPGPGYALASLAEAGVLLGFLRPSLYWMPASLPFLGLGETTYSTEFPIRRLSGVEAGLLHNWPARARDANRARAVHVAALQESCRIRKAPVTTPCLRLPIVFESREERDRLYAESQRQRLGFSLMYPSSIAGIPQLRPTLDGRRFPNAERIAERPAHRAGASAGFGTRPARHRRCLAARAARHGVWVMAPRLFFWGCAAFVVYAYAGYAVALWALARLRGRPVHRADITPSVSLIITVRNEQARIAQKLAQTMALDYPAGLLEVVVASDCSTDGTHAIVEGYSRHGVRLIVAPERHGKEFAQRMAIAASTGEILIFSDVATRLDRDGLRHLVRNFADSTVGCVSSVDRLLGPDGQISGEGLYVRYEMLLRSLESAVGTVVGLSGSLFAARRQVCEPWAIDLPSDFTTLLNTLAHGLRGVSDEASIGYYSDLADKSREYQRKVRTITRGLSGFSRHLHLLNPFRYGLAAWQLFSHKLCRWLVPFALLGMLAASSFLSASSPFYFTLTLAQVAAYATAAYGYRRADRLNVLARTLTFFVLANVSILNAWFNLLSGRQIVTWEPSKRPDVVGP